MCVYVQACAYTTGGRYNYIRYSYCYKPSNGTLIVTNQTKKLIRNSKCEEWVSRHRILTQNPLVSISISNDVCMYVCTHIHTNTRTDAHAHLHRHTYTHAHAHKHTHAHAHTRAHFLSRTWTHLHAYTY